MNYQFYKGTSLRIPFKTALPELGGVRKRIIDFKIAVKAQGYVAEIINIDDYSFNAVFSAVSTLKFQEGAVDVVLYLTKDNNTSIGKLTGLFCVHPQEGEEIPVQTSPIEDGITVNDIDVVVSLNNLFTYQDLSQSEKLEMIAEIAQEADQLFSTLTLSVNNKLSDVDQYILNVEEQVEVLQQQVINAESARASAEQTRATAESSRSSAESARASAEQTRVTAESSRSSAESARASAEQTRATAESSRSSAESARASAEAARNVASNVYNITLAVPLAAGTYYTSTTARAAVPTAIRKRGLELIYETSAGVWYRERFVGASTTTWTTATDWELVPTKKYVDTALELKAAHGYDSNPKTLKQVDDSLVQLAGDFDAKLPINILTSNGSESLTQIGFMRPDGTTGTSSSYRYTQPVEIAVGVTEISLKTYLSGLTVAPIVFFDSNNQFLKGETITATGWHEKTYKVPAGAKFFVVSCDTPYISEFFANQTKIDVPSKAYISSEIAINTTLRQPDFIKTSDFTITGFMRSDGTTSENINYRRTGLKDLTGVSKLYIKTTTGGVTVSPIVFFDSNSNYISGITPSVATEIEIEVAKPINAKYAVLSIYNNAAAYSTFKTDVDIAIKNYDFGEKKSQCYISASGDDANGGSSSSPVKTISRALQLLSEDGELIFMEGDYKGFTFDLSAFAKITGIGNVRFLGGTFIESATLSSGYTRVYQASYATTISAGYFLWQHDIADEATVIDINERHPLHRGRRTRLSSTRIYQASSIAEIEATTDVLMWFQEAGILYFSKTDGSDLSVNPIVIPYGSYIASKKNRVEINNLQFLYNTLITTNLSGILENVSVGFTNWNGAIIYNECVGLTFRNCEAFACINDGFNGHTYGGGRTTVVFENCYGHDNSDDGESCHEYCDIIHKGGLYEYNGSGVTPASGGHAICYDVLCRKNGGHPWNVAYSDTGTGFNAQGASIDDGIGTNIWCFNCISIGNSLLGFGGVDSSSKFMNCISNGDAYAFGTGEKINCITIP